MNKPLIDAWTKLLQKQQTNQTGRPFQVLIHSDALDLHLEYPAQSAVQVFHIASVSKLITTTYVLRLVEEGSLKLTDPLTLYLENDVLQGLFISDPSTITIEDCLIHRSGAADFFEGKDKQGLTFLKRVIQHPDEIWTASSLLDYTRQNMKPIAKVKERFNYGDTAFLLIILIIEKIKQEPFASVIDRELLKPLGMHQTQALFHTYPKTQRLEPLDMWIDGTEVKRFKSVSCDQADGGFVSTPQDLLRFQSALYSGQLISAAHLKKMQDWQGKFRAGIHYGMGMMQIRFEEFFFLLRGLPRLIGHIGILSTYAFYDVENDLHVILNMGGTKNMSKGFILLSKLFSIFKASQKK